MGKLVEYYELKDMGPIGILHKIIVHVSWPI